MGLTALGKGLGTVRTAILASRLGTGSEADALATATRIPTLLFDLLLGAALPACFIPAFHREKGRGTALLCLVTVLMPIGGLCLLAKLSPGTLLQWFAPGLKSETGAMTLAILPTALLILLPMGGVALLTALCQAEGRYRLPALVGILGNGLTCLILPAIPGLTAASAVWVLLLGWAVQLAALIPVLRLLSDEPPHLAPLKLGLRGYPAALFSSWLLPVAFSVLLTAASYPPDSTARWDHAVTLFSAALGITVSGAVNYGFPRFTAANSRETRRREATEGLLRLLAVSLPLSLLLCLLAPEGVALLLQRGRFGSADTAAVAFRLSLLAPALPLCAAEEWLRRLAIAEGARWKALIPTGIGCLLLLPAARWPLFPPYGIAAALFLTYLTVVGLRLYLLRKLISLSSLLPSLAGMLSGLALICLLYRGTDHLIPVGTSLRLLALPATVIPVGGLLYLGACRLIHASERRYTPL